MRLISIMVKKEQYNKIIVGPCGGRTQDIRANQLS